MRISEHSIKRPVTTLMIVFAVIILGFVSFSKLNIDLLPNINLPYAMVSTDYSGAGPKEVENIVTKNLESVLSTVANIKNVNSISSEGRSMIILEFNQGTNMDFATLEVREKLDLIKKMLPEGVSSPMVLKLNPNMMPIMNIAAYHKTKGPMELKSWIENTLKPRIDRIEGVASTSITGGLEKEISVSLDPYKMASKGLSTTNVVNALRMDSIDLPAGIIEDGKYNLILRTTGEFTDIKDIESVKIPSPARGVNIELSEIASVKEDIKTKNVYSKVNGKDSIGISIQKESNANTVKVSKAINEEIAKILTEEKDVSIKNIYDQALFINHSIDSVKSNAVVGGILAILILLFFLRDLAPTIVISVSIPISVIATFILIYFAKITLNMISLGGIALGIGMLVDNSIVVLENIYRLKKEGLSTLEAAKKGSSEVAMAIIASTLTTICVFLPIIFVEGITAELFKQLALTVTFSLVSSLIVALTLVPTLSSKLFNKTRGEKKNKIIERLKISYEKLLIKSLNHKILISIIVISTFALSILSLKIIGTEFFPYADQGLINISVKLPKGSTFERVKDSLQSVENRLKGIDEIELLSSNISSGQMNTSSSNGNTGNIDLVLKNKKHRKRSDTEIAEDIRNKLSNIAGCKIKVNTSGNMFAGPGSGNSPITIEVQGENMDTLNNITNDLMKKVEKIEGVREVRSSFETGSPEYKIAIDKDKASAYGLNTAMISTEVQNQIKGVTATRYKFQGKELDIKVKRADSQEKISKKDLENLLIPSPLGTNVPLSSIANFKEEIGLASISRKNGDRMLSINFSINDRAVGDVLKEVENITENHKLPEGYFIKLSGESEEMKDAFSNLKLALILGIILIYMVMASQFESLLYPFIIMFTVPLAITGAFLGLFIARIPLSVPGILGIIVLMGVAVNNGIVLVDYINTLRSYGLNREEAIIKAGPTRLQPILMTTLTTVLGLLPLALAMGEGAEIEQPLAVTLIGGLTFSTILTLFVVPVIYIFMDNLQNRVKTIFSKNNL
ncbi:efflux RND transporter permease subunit [Hathewaya massiliensis]|uniref:efflux RND transporter permease subunit n=1 Tax=Hathewaya massiliensis TaxID=1964382 RepID=UPI0011578D27|nr:efflux RND transporter permease subunit [Hathewaya massiliensis]